MTNKTKLLKIFLLTIIPLSILFIIIVNKVVLNKIHNKEMVEYKEELILEEKKKLLTNIKLLKRYLNKQLTGKSPEKLTQSELDLYKKEVLKYIENISVDETYYYWISDKNLNIIFHPINKNLENKNIKDIGSKFTINYSNKDAYLQYSLNTNGKSIDKIAAISLFAPLNWVVGKSIKLPEINKKILKREEHLLQNHDYVMKIFCIFLIIYILIIIYIIIKKSDSSIFIPMENRLHILNTKLSQKNNQLKKRLLTDELTGLKNMNALQKDTKGNDYSTLLLIDIDSFNNINKLYGYQVGDEVLKEYAKTLNTFAEKNNYKCYRIYANTFALLGIKAIIEVEKYHRDLLKLITQHIKINFNESDLYHSDIDITLDINIGVCLAQNNALIKANIALESAKQEMKRYFVYHGELNEKKRIEKYINSKRLIDDAIKNDGVIPYFQPILTEDRKIVKYEALMRLKVNDKIILPYMFLDVSVKTKLYSILSITMIEKALNKAKMIKRAISINISTDDCMNPKLNSMLQKYLNQNDIPLCKLVTFEILESQSIDNFEIINTFLSKYRQLGVKIAIDDFGTGYSNFSNILLLKPDYIKIDGSLIKDIDTSKDNLILVKSIINFTKTLNILTIAEFIHNKDVFDICKDLGINRFQGYYFYEPSDMFLGKYK